MAFVFLWFFFFRRLFFYSIPTSFSTFVSRYQSTRCFLYIEGGMFFFFFFFFLSFCSFFFLSAVSVCTVNKISLLYQDSV